MKRLLLTGALVALFSFGATAALAGPRCTTSYPRGFKVHHGTKKHPLLFCTGGDIESTWGKCTLHYSA